DPSTRLCLTLFYFLNATPRTEIHTLSLHDALPICAFDFPRLNRAVANGSTGQESVRKSYRVNEWFECRTNLPVCRSECADKPARSEEHTSELQSRGHLVCRLLLEKKKRFSKDS